ncbi:MAG: hypothetical protein IT437_13695 [Phycisphaerales bacterium]|nr:hypothetical protein [Phycisphaerales bacterium]
MAVARSIPARLAAAWLAPLGRMGVPLGVSIFVHGLLLAGLAGVGWSLRIPIADDLGSEVLLVAPPPPPLALAQGRRRSGPEPEPVVYIARQEITPDDLPQAPPSAAITAIGRPAPGPTTVPVQPEKSRPTVREAPRPAATFAGVGVRQVQSVVYVLDGSGAMVTNLKWVLQEVERSIVALDPKQSFQVVLFRDRGPGVGGAGTEVFRAGNALIPATAANKAAVAAWLQQVRPSGRSNPMDGVRRALSLQPDVVFLLSRGMQRTEAGQRPGDWSRGAAAVLKELDGLNPRAGKRHRAIIKTIQFLEDDPTGTMQAIAAEHGDGPGSYSIITLQELRRGR